MSASKRVPHGGRRHYAFEAVEPRRLLSVASALAALPAGQSSHPIIAIASTFQPATGAGATPGTYAIGQANPVFGTITPAQMRGAYNVVGSGAGETIAIVDAYDDPNAVADLATFDARYNLQAPASFTKLNQTGGPVTANNPGTDPNGPAYQNGNSDDATLETSLDIEWAHAIAPAASIVLIECDGLDDFDLYTGIATAASLPNVCVVSMSFGGGEYAGETAEDGIFTTPAGHQGVTFVASAGDSGIYAADGNPADTPVVQPVYPASSPNVVAVGGTSLTLSGTNYGSESGWGSGTASPSEGGGGGGVSTYETAPDYQTFVTGNLGGGMRTYPDVAMDADPDTGVSVVDSYDTGSSNQPWIDTSIGGTSLAAPMFSGIVAIADAARASAGLTTLDGATQTLPHLYELPSNAFHDITTGNNGDQAGVGYDLVTGRGSPVGSVMIQDLGATYIGYHVFDDVSADGIQEAGEPGVGGVAVSLETTGGTVLQTTTTDANGFYQFQEPTAGTYVVHFTAPTGYLFGPIGTATDPLLDSNANPTTGNVTATISANGSQVGATDYPYANCGLFRETVSITDVAVERPQSGTTPMTFTVTVTPLSTTSAFDIPYTTVDGNAADVTATTGPATVAHDDYQATSGTLVFAPGVGSETITVQIVGNALIEKELLFTVKLTPPPAEFDVADSKTVGTGAIVNTSFPSASVATQPSDTVTRSATLSQVIDFPVSLSAPAPFPVTVNYATADVSAFGGADYAITSGTLTFTPDPTTGLTPTLQDVPVTVYPGSSRQLNKTFDFDVSGTGTSVTGTPATAVGTILTNAPPAVSVEPGTVTESLTGTALLPFNVDVAPSLTSPLTVSYTTADGTAVAGVDYTASSGTLTFTPGRVQQTVYVPVFRQFLSATTKTLSFTISNPSAAIDLVSPTVTGTITYLPVTTLDFDKSKKAVYTDNLGQRVTVSLSGAGSGDVVFLGTDPVATNAFEMSLTGTTAASNLAVSVSGGGQTTVGAIEVEGSLNALSAKDVNVQGSAANVTVSGSIASLALGYLSQATIDLGGTATGRGETINLLRAVNTAITSAAPIRTLTAGAYTNTTPATPVYVTAPSVGTIHVTGNFGATVQTSGAVAAVIVGGALLGGIDAGGGIGSVVADSLSGASLLAGAGIGTDSLSTATFTNTAASIGRVQVKSTFSDSVIAGWTVGRVKLGSVQTAAGGSPFGIVGDHITSVQTTVVGKSVTVAHPTSSVQYNDFAVDLL